MEYMSDIINGLILLGVAVIEARATLARKRQHEEAAQAEKRAGQRAKESLVSMQYMDAILGYAIATGIAVSEGKVNGEMSAAKEAAANVKKEYDAFIKKTAAEHITK